MGRTRKMELIGDDKSRIRTLNQRAKGLTKQLEQLATLCDVPACIVIRDPTTGDTFTWPPDDPDLFRRLLTAGRKDGARRYGVSDFFKERRNQAEGELLKMRKKKNDDNNVGDFLSSMDEGRLRELAAAVRAKAEAVRSRIEFLKREEMRKKNDKGSDSAHIDDQDLIFMDMRKKENNLFAYSESAHIDKDMIFMDAMRKKNMFAYSDSAHIDQDMIFMDAMKKKNNVFAYSDLAYIDQNMIFMDAMNNNMFGYSDYDIDQDMITSGVGFMEVMKKINLFGDSDSAQFGDVMINSGGFVEMEKDDEMMFDYSDLAQFGDMIEPGGFVEMDKDFDYSDLAQFGDMIKSGGFVEMNKDGGMRFDYPELY